MIGTASRVRAWVLIEQPGPWGRDALRESRVERNAARALDQRARQTEVRVLLIRRTGWEPLGDTRRAYLAHTGAAGSWMEELELTDPATLLDLDWAGLHASDPPGEGQPHAGVYLVCTNGKHDACCADLGRPLVRALLRAGVEDVWESSHVGGDRFAANLVCLPDGVYYGRVEPGEAAALVATDREGRVMLDRYRGRSCYPPLVQTAELHARRATGESGVYGVAVTATEALGRDGRRVHLLTSAGASVEVDVVRRRSDDAVHLTCTSDDSVQPWVYELEDLRMEPDLVSRRR